MVIRNVQYSSVHAVNYNYKNVVLYYIIPIFISWSVFDYKNYNVCGFYSLCECNSCIINNWSFFPCRSRH